MSDFTTVDSVGEWRKRFPWLSAGTTWRGSRSAAAEAGGRWRSVVRSRQVHGAVVRVHGRGRPGSVVAGEADGHATRSAGLLLTATVADCVPVFVADPRARAVALLHAGWRGTAAGVVERGVAVMARAFGSDPGDVVVHLGPAICGACYEVGPEVFEALGLPSPDRPTPLDLRAEIRRRATALGVRPGLVSVDAACTLCDGAERYYSHRRGDGERQRAYIGVRRRGPLP